jgi:predicted metal-dependent HD superfamily phosphohydrolase
MILASKHKSVSHNIGSKMLCDIDLAILGQSQEVFDEYEIQIRSEYNWVSETDFVKGRSKVLQSFLNRPKVYSMEFFREKYEEQARKNLAHSIEQLSHRLHS